MKKGYGIALLALAVLAFAGSAQAQTTVIPGPTVKLAFDAPTAVAEAVTKFSLYSDSVKVSETNLPTERDFPFPALKPGQHTLEVTATNGVGESAKSAALIVLVIVTVPGAPSNLRIITARWTAESGWTPVLEFV